MKQQASVLQHQGFVCLQTGCVVQWDSLRWHYPGLCTVPCLWLELRQLRMCVVPNCASAQLCTFLNIVINVLDCEWKDLLTHIHSCHVCCGFRGCSQRETVAAESQQEWEHVSAIKLYQKKMQQDWKCLGWCSRILIWLSHSVPRGF